MVFFCDEYILVTNDLEEKILAKVLVLDESCKAIVDWCSDVDSIVIYNSLHDFKKISCNPTRKLLSITIKGNQEFEKTVV